MKSAAERQLIALAKEALARRDDLAGAGQAIVKSFGIEPKLARDLQMEEVRRRREGNDHGRS